MKTTSKVFDGLLVLQYLAGHNEAMSLLVKRHQNRLCKQAYWYTRDMNSAKDIVQDNWAIIINKLDHLKDPNLFGSWALRIVIRKSLDFVKQQHKSRAALQEVQESNEESESELKEKTIEKLRHAISALPLNQQQVIQLFYTEEYSLKEISVTLEISVGTVKSRLFHAREKLKLFLK